MLVDPTETKKTITTKNLERDAEAVTDPSYWTNLSPGARLTLEPRAATPSELLEPAGERAASASATLREEAYCQLPASLPAAVLQEMRMCIDDVRRGNLPLTMALVYDVFFEALSYFRPSLESILGEDPQLIPQFWIYYVGGEGEPAGFPPHRDGEYPDTLMSSGLPSLLTFWLPITDATPLNSCMYMLPANRDPLYQRAITELRTEIPAIDLQDLRAMPLAAGGLGLWDQYILHWGSRGSRFAPEPRISYAAYLQRGDIPPWHDSAMSAFVVPGFRKRLSIAVESTLRYSQFGRKNAQAPAALQALIIER